MPDHGLGVLGPAGLLAQGHDHPAPISTSQMNLQNTRCVWFLQLLSHFRDERTEMESLAPGLGGGERGRVSPGITPPHKASHPISCLGKAGCFLEVRNKPSAPGGGQSAVPPPRWPQPHSSDINYMVNRGRRRRGEHAGRIPKARKGFVKSGHHTTLRPVLTTATGIRASERWNRK